ncbi:Glycosyl transferase family 2 [Vibrio xiamenensis]|uniref:Glycosyl transferase family 2 n=1 Tax=Vibrio xiamenensis TaxID=861298 RepID=A0A1G8C7N9_9VIBR|nr:glycosyltransferase [Vibrio xiamenensis]SDH41424.1 Glycosyl transferase family 2 [Vibrio xiamenensis]
MKNIAVLMSVYKNDNYDMFKKALNSMRNQVGDFNIHVYLMLDGPVEEAIVDFIHDLNEPDKIFVLNNEKSKGLAFSLNRLMESATRKKITYDFFARMDSDDISRLDRFKIQVEELEQSDIDIVGSDMIEIDENENHLSYKRMAKDNNEIIKNIVYRCPLNHPSVTFKSHVIYNGLRYNGELKNTQDYFMWVDALKKGYKLGNVNLPLLYFRVSGDFLSRRTSKKAMNDVRARLYASKELNKKKFKIKDYLFILSILIVRFSPKFVMKFVYKMTRESMA